MLESVSASNSYMLSARSSWSYIMPVSITATTTSSDSASAVCAQTAGIFMRSSPHCSP